MEKKLLGIDLGGTSIKLAILTLEGEIQHKWSIPTNILDQGSHIVPDIIASIQHQWELLGLNHDHFQGIGMGSPGVVDRSAGTVIGAYNLNWKTKQEIKAAMEQALSLPFYIDNDANVAALGEKWVGAGNNDPDVVFVTLGTGVGGGVIADNHLIHGVAGAGGEIGHLVVDFDQPIACTCGKQGCLETVASATGVVNLTRRYAESYAGDSKLKAMVDDGQLVTSKDVFDMAKEGDALALIVFKHFCRYLGIACSHLGNMLNPSTIVLGGGVSAAGSFLLEGVQKVFDLYAFPQVVTTTKLSLAQLGNDAGVIGAASLVLQ